MFRVVEVLDIITGMDVACHGGGWWMLRGIVV